MAGEVTPERPAFSLATRQILGNALLNLPLMQTPDRRDHLFAQLSSDYTGLRSVHRSPDPYLDLMEIVLAAHDYPGALRAILHIVVDLYPGDRRLREIKAVVDVADPESPLTGEERKKLLDHLRPVDPSVVAAAFHYSDGATLHDLGLEVHDLAAIVTRVESHPARPGQLPVLFPFIDHIAHRLPQPKRAALHILMDGISLRLGYDDRAAVDKLCQATDNRLASSGRYYLVAELRPDLLRADHFFLAAWRQHEDEAEETLYQAEQSVRWDEAITITHRLMRQLASNVEGTAEERVLELILPRSLVTHDIDQWQVGEILPAAIGTNYPLVLRSFDRLDDPTMHVEWARNWRWVKQNDRTAGGAAIREVESHQPEAVQALRGALLRGGPPAIVIMLTALPSSDSLGADAFTAGLYGGASIMLWSRHDETAKELADSVRSACRDGLLRLPEHIFQLRLTALEESSSGPSASLHTTIVFDDFDRIPERFRRRARLRSPYREEAR